MRPKKKLRRANSRGGMALTAAIFSTEYRNAEKTLTAYARARPRDRATTLHRVAGFGRCSALHVFQIAARKKRNRTETDPDITSPQSRLSPLSSSVRRTQNNIARSRPCQISQDCCLSSVLLGWAFGGQYVLNHCHPQGCAHVHHVREVFATSVTSEKKTKNGKKKRARALVCKCLGVPWVWQVTGGNPRKKRAANDRNRGLRSQINVHSCALNDVNTPH